MVAKWHGELHPGIVCWVTADTVTVFWKEGTVTTFDPHDVTVHTNLSSQPADVWPVAERIMIDWYGEWHAGIVYSITADPVTVFWDEGTISVLPLNIARINKSC